MINGIPFRLHEIIYQGSDSRVFSASFSKGGRDSAFVVKCYRCPRDGEVWHKAMREIEAGMMLRKCPHIVRLQGYSVLSEEQGTACEIFLLFDRLPCLGEMTVGTRAALEICRDISLALCEFRRKGLLHGDVKPSNLFFDGQGWRLGDLGSVCLSGQSPEYGSRGYASPEALRGESCDSRSDIYSLGMTLYKILSGGRLPFCDLPCEEMSEEDVNRAIDRRLDGEEIPPISGLRDELNRLLLKMCRFRPRDRFGNPRQIARAAGKTLQKAFSTDID